MDFTFENSATVESLEAVPEDFRPMYGDSGDGKFSLNEALKPVAGAITRFQTALKAARLEAKNRPTEKVDWSLLHALGFEGSSLEEIAPVLKSKMEELETAAAGSKEAKLNLDKVKADLQKGHAKELAIKDQRNTALKTQLDKLMVENVATSALNDQKGDVEILMPHLRQHITSVEEDGEFKVYVVDPKTKEQRYSGVTAQPMSIKELVAEFKASDKFKKCFASESPSGGGMKPGGGNTNKRLPQGDSENQPKGVARIKAALDSRK